MSLQDLRDLGYSVEPAQQIDTKLPTVYFVAGFGLRTYVKENDTATVASLVASHPSRKGYDPNAVWD